MASKGELLNMEVLDMHHSVLANKFVEQIHPTPSCIPQEHVLCVVSVEHFFVAGNSTDDTTRHK
uniref:Uncharacterized protein n=1 Tax=Pristionchus pacificus TaxID=54126 RepID=A0A2A6CDS5_PRIPA|eukprot:PDM76238.1 hypothetical protein PRIPAC_39842 [Pristionchus pacificus]